MNKLSGYKTYAACAAGIAWAIYGLVTGNLDATAAGHLIETALIGAGLRNAVATK